MLTIFNHLIGHFYAIFYGVLASSLCLAFFYLLGWILFPRVLFKNTNFTAMPFFYGAAAFSLICWYGIQCGISLFEIFKYLPILVLFAIILRKRNTWTSILDNLTRGIPPFTKGGAGGIFYLFLPYLIFYTLAYAFLPQSVSPHGNLLQWIGNNDILNYINITHYLGHLGPSNVVGHSYLDHASYAATPAVFYCLSFLSLFYHGDTLSAAMPMLFTSMALIGLMIARYCRELFNLSKTISVSIAAIVITGPFYHYIAGNYFLSTLIVTPILIYLLTETVQLDFNCSENKLNPWKYLFYITLPCQLLIFFLYPVILFCSVIIQWGLIGLKALCSCDNFSWNSIKIWLNLMLKSTSVLFSCLALLYLSNPANFVSFLITLADFAHMTGGGWGLHLISPFGILGIPGNIQVSSTILQILTLIGFSAFIIFCTTSIKKQIKSNILSRSGLVFFFFSVMAFVAYFLYYYHLGPSRYQPWKFASYYALPFSGAIWAMFSNLVQWKNKSYSWNKITIVLALLSILGNAFILWYLQPPLQTISAKYRRLEALDQMDVSEFWVKMSSYSSTFLPVYFIPNKVLHLLSDSYYPVQLLGLTQITPKKPFFMEMTGKCVGTKSDNVIKIMHVGCLYLKMPTLQFNERIKFSEKPIFIETKGFGDPEPQGEWTTENFSRLTIYTESIFLKHHPAGYLHFKVEPFLYPAIQGQHVKFLWGENHDLSLYIKKKQWITLPYDTQDWRNANPRSLRKITISMQFPDAIAMNKLNPDNVDERAFGLTFIQLLANNQALKDGTNSLINN